MSINNNNYYCYNIPLYIVVIVVQYCYVYSLCAILRFFLVSYVL